MNAAPSVDKTPLPRWVLGPLKAAVSIAAMAIIWRQVNLAQLMGIAAASNMALVATAVVIYIVGQGLTSYRWFLITRTVGFEYKLPQILRFYFIGMFFNLFGPSTFGGDFVRSLYLGERDGRRAVALNTVLFDRLIGLNMLIAVAAVSLIAFGRYQLPWPLVWITFGVGIAMIAAWGAIPVLVRSTLKETSRLRVLVEKDLGAFWNDRGLLSRTAGISIGFHLLQITALVILGHAVGVTLPWPYYFIFHPLVTIAAAIPISVAGLGIREMGYVWFLQRQAVPHDVAVAFGLAWLLVIITSSLLGGLVYLASGSSLPQLRGTAHK